MLRNYIVALALLSGCNHTQTIAYEPLKIPVIQGEERILSESERKELRDELVVRRELLSILTKLKEDLVSKLAKAESFSFALSDEDRLQAKAGKLLLQYINETMAKTELRIREIQQLLR